MLFYNKELLWFGEHLNSPCKEDKIYNVLNKAEYRGDQIDNTCDYAGSMPAENKHNDVCDKLKDKHSENYFENIISHSVEFVVPELNREIADSLNHKNEGYHIHNRWKKIHQGRNSAVF